MAKQELKTEETAQNEVSLESKNQEITPEVKATAPEPEFKIVGVQPGKVIFKDKTYDLSKIDLETAKRLAKEGLPYIQLIE